MFTKMIPFLSVLGVSLAMVGCENADPTLSLLPESQALQPITEKGTMNHLSKKDRNTPSLSSGDIEDEIPDEIFPQWNEAKQNNNKTTILRAGEDWYILPIRGYVVEQLVVENKKGTLILKRASELKANNVFYTIARNYDLDSLDVEVKD